MQNLKPAQFNIDLLKRHPAFPLAEHITSVLNDQGYTAFFAGGCVRDGLLGREPKDLDIATDAVPDVVEKLFAKTVPTGKSFGVIRVIDGGLEVEVATFRSEGAYQDGRHPGQVKWSSPNEDAIRRDFTVNAMFFDLQSNRVIDYVGGLNDLANRILKTVGAPKDRFNEDHLRILRAIRFAYDLGFKLDPKTETEVKARISLVKTVSRERIRDEVIKIMKGGLAIDCFAKCQEWGLWKELFPEAKPQFQKYLSAKNFFNRQPIENKWALFFLFLYGEVVGKDVLEKLVLTRNEQRRVSAFLNYLRSENIWPNKPLAEKLKEWGDDAFRLYVDWLIQSGAATWAHQLYIELKNRNFLEGLPEPILKGDDLKYVQSTKEISGPEVGRILDEAYGQQLEKQWTTSHQGIEWLKKYGSSK